MFWKLVRQVHFWKLGCLLWDLKPLLLREKLRVLSSPSCGLPYQGWSLWYDCVPVSPTCFSAGPLSVTRYVGVTQFLGFFRGSCSVCSHRIGVCMEWVQLPPVLSAYAGTQAFNFYGLVMTIPARYFFLLLFYPQWLAELLLDKEIMNNSLLNKFPELEL